MIKIQNVSLLISGVLMIIIASIGGVMNENAFAANSATNLIGYNETIDTVSPSGNCTYQNVAAEDLIINSINGTNLKQLTVGSQVSLEATVVDDCNVAKYPFMIVVEVRDSAGVTHYLGWQKFTINPGERMKVGFSWTADEAGNYQMRTLSIHCPTCIGYYPFKTLNFVVNEDPTK
jgi:hypothetical protein